MTPTNILRLVCYTAALMFAALSYRLGYSAGGDRELARASAATVAASNAAVASESARFGSYRAQVEALRIEARDLQLALGKAKAERRVVYRSIREEVSHAVEKDATRSLARGAVPSDGGGHCALGAEFVRVWDAALDPAGAGVPGAAGLAPGDAAAALPSARFDAEDILANHVDNAELAADLRAQLQALIDWHLHGGESP